MAISLYDASVATYLQTLGAIIGFLDKGDQHFQANGIAHDEIVETRLYPDMLPFRFQLVSVVHQSLGAIKALQAGEFRPPAGVGDQDYAGLQQLVVEARDELQGVSREDVDALEGREVAFVSSVRKLSFVAEDFVMSFSLPNFFFHATTAYDILRMKGVPIGKRDFLGRLRLKT